MTSLFPRASVGSHAASHLARGIRTCRKRKHLSRPRPPSLPSPPPTTTTPSSISSPDEALVAHPAEWSFLGRTRDTCVPHRSGDTCGAQRRRDVNLYEPHGYARRPRRRPYFLPALSLISNISTARQRRDSGEESGGSARVTTELVQSWRFRGTGG